MGTEPREPLHPSVSIKIYEKSDFDTLVYLLTTNGFQYLSDLTPETVPTLGFIATIDQTPAAAGFIRMVEGYYGQIDTLVTNKHLSSRDRHAAISMTIDCLIDAARVANLRGIVSFTDEESIAIRARELGFEVKTKTVMSLRTGKADTEF